MGHYDPAKSTTAFQRFPFSTPSDFDGDTNVDAFQTWDDTVTIGNLQVRNQTVGVVWNSTGINIGALGLSATYFGYKTDPRGTDPNSLLEKLARRGIIASRSFSLGLGNRSANAGKCISKCDG